MIQETDLRIISLMIEKKNRLIEVVSYHSREEIETVIYKIKTRKNVNLLRRSFQLIH